MKKVIVAALFLGLGTTGFSSPEFDHSSTIVKVDKKKNKKKKGHRKGKHKKCEAFQG